MPVIHDDEVLGYIVGQEYVCRECVDNDEKEAITINDLICDGADGYQCFCDRCGKRIL